MSQTTIVIPAISPVSTPPNSSQSEDEFNANADALLGHLPDLVNDINAFASAANQLGDAINEIALVATQAGGAVRWIQGQGYDVGAPVYSPLNFQTYRAKIQTASAQHKRWRFRSTQSNGAPEIYIAEMEMFSVVGGSDITGLYGTAFANYTQYSGASDAFDNSNSTSVNFNSQVGYVGKDFGADPKAVVGYSLTITDYTTRAPRTGVFEWSDDDGATWTAVHSFTDVTNWTAFEKKTFYFVGEPGTLDPSLDSTNWEKISGTTDADTVDGFHASQTPVAGQIPAIKGDGTTAFPGGISVGNANANGGSILLNWVEKASCTLTATGMSTTPSGTATLVRVGDMVTLSIPVIGGTSNTSVFTLTGLPTSFRPSATKVCYVRVIDNGGTIAMGIASIASTGVISLYRGPDGGVWTTTGAKSIQSSTISFDI